MDSLPLPPQEQGPQPNSTPYSEAPPDPVGQTVIVLVGRGIERTTFVVRASQMVFYSDYFRHVSHQTYDFTRCNGVIRMPGEDPDIFKMAHLYLTTRNFFEDWTTNAFTTITFDQIIELHSLSIRLRIPLVSNAALDLFAYKVKHTRTLPDRWSIEYLWEQTTPGSAPRRFLVELARELWNPLGKHPVWIYLAGGNAPHDIPGDIIWVLEEFRRSGKSIRLSDRMLRRVQSCQFHIHGRNVFCEGSEEARLWPGGDPEEVADLLRLYPRTLNDNFFNA